MWFHYNGTHTNALISRELASCIVSSKQPTLLATFCYELFGPYLV